MILWTLKVHFKLDYSKRYKYLKSRKIPLFFFRLCESIDLRGIERFLQSSGYLRSVRWLIAYPVDWSKMCFSSMGLSIVRKYMIANEVNLKIYENSKVKFHMKFLKWNSYEQLKMHHNSWEGILQNRSSRHLSNCLDLKTLPSIGQWRYFRTRGPGSGRTFELCNLSITRQVPGTQVS